MKKLITLIISCAFLTLFIAGHLSAADHKIIARGKWGKEIDQLGISFPAPGVMPIAPYMSIGGFDVDEKGKLWIADSLNRKIKSFKNREWRYAMVNCESMGDLVHDSGKLFVISRNPDGLMIFDTDKEKVERLIKVSFKSPLRISVINKTTIAIEEQSGGVWLVNTESEKSYLHPATSLEACGKGSSIYGLQKNFDSENRSLIQAQLAEKIQEPEVVTTLEFSAESRIIFAKLAGMKGNDPVAMTINAESPDKILFTRIKTNASPQEMASLPIFDGPYLLSSWKLCSDGNFYGFEGTASEGFKIYQAIR